MAYPLLFPLLGLVLGMELAVYFPFSSLGFCWGSGGILFLLGLLMLLRRNPILKWGLVFCFFLALGLVRMGSYYHGALPEPFLGWIQTKSPQRVRIRSTEFCQNKGRYSEFAGRVLSYQGKAGWQKTQLPILFRVEGDHCSVSPGDYYQTLATFRISKGFKNPTGLDPHRWLRARGVSATAWIRGSEYLVPMVDSIPASVGWRRRIRDQIATALANGVAEPAVHGVLAALLLRQTEAVPELWQENFRRLGLSHLLVVSGLHLGMLYGLFFFCLYVPLYFCRQWAEAGHAKVIAIVIALFPLLVYVATVGWSASTLRAWGLLTLTGFCFCVGQRGNFFSRLLFLAWVLLLCQPQLLLNLSFQISFLSVLALFIFGKNFQKNFAKLAESFPRVDRCWLRGPLALILNTCFLQWALFPIFSHHFHQVSWVAPLTNLISIPWVGFVLLPWGLLGMILSLGSPLLGRYCFKLLGVFTQAWLNILTPLARLEWVSPWVAPLQGWYWLAWAMLLLGFLWWSHPRRLFLGMVLGLLFWWGPSLFRPRLASSLSWEVVMFDVGQGESLLLKTPRGKNILIDGGGFPYSDFDVGRQVLLPELLARRIFKLDAVALTHGDADHANGLKFFLESFPVGEVWVADFSKEDEVMGKWIRLAESRGIPVRALSRGQHFVIGGLAVSVLWPPAPDPHHSEVFSDNNQSLVLKTCFEQDCILFTGDIEEEVEAILAEDPQSISAQVIKVPHHGSRTSSQEGFLEAVAPRWGLISAGQGNRFGFPHSEVLARFQKAGIEIFRTDALGQVGLRFHRKYFFWQTMEGGVKKINRGSSPIR